MEAVTLLVPPFDTENGEKPNLSTKACSVATDNNGLSEPIALDPKSLPIMAYMSKPKTNGTSALVPMNDLLTNAVKLLLLCERGSFYLDIALTAQTSKAQA